MTTPSNAGMSTCAGGEDLSTWITRLGEGSGRGPRVAVKDAIDVEGVPTTVGCKAIADLAKPASRDAACVAGIRSAGARIVGKANLHELCFGTAGINPVFGTPHNPLWPGRVPGGSSSGSAVAVATDEADYGIGTDTGGSVRIPAACCGVVGLKTTFGRVPLEGVWPLAPSLDTVGPLARDVAGVIAAMALMEPGFSTDGVSCASRVGRIRPGGVAIEPGFDSAVDVALRGGQLDSSDVQMPSWQDAMVAMGSVLPYEAWRVDAHLLDVDGGVAEPVRSRLERAADVTHEQHQRGEEFRARWREELLTLLGRFEVLALPTLSEPPCKLDAPDVRVPNALCAPINLAGLPAISIPLPDRASLQLVGPPNGEELLCATAAVIEQSVAR